MAARKIRIHELAKQLGMTNAEVLDLCGVLGVAAEGPSSSLAEAYADMVTRRAERDGLTRDDQPDEPKPVKKAASGQPKRPAPRPKRSRSGTSGLPAAPGEGVSRVSDHQGGLADTSQQIGPDSTPEQRRILAEGSAETDRSTTPPEEPNDHVPPPMEDFGETVRETYPYPLAYRWQVTVSNSGRPEELKSILHAQETLIAYLAIVALTSARLGDVTLGPMDEIRIRLGKRRGGLGLGDWRSILRAASEQRKMIGLPDTHPFVRVREYFATAETLKAADRLNKLRNDTAHMRAFRPGEEADAIRSARENLAVLYAAASLIAGYPLIHVIESHWDSLARRNELTYRPLRGANPFVQVQTMIVDSSEIERGSLYLIDSRGEAQRVSPLLVAADCPSCEHFSTFHPDQVLPDGQVEYRSLEHGHALVPRNAARRLAAVGFLSATD